jgi:hypothetical protein
MAGEWPKDPNVESIQRILARRECELRSTVECLRGLATHIEWENDTKPTLDTDGLLETWGRVERVLDRYEGEVVNEIPPGVTPRMNGQQVPVAAGATEDRLAIIFDRVRRDLRESRGLDVTAEMTDVERDAWTRELGFEVMVTVAQMFDPATGICFHPDALAKFRRRRALLALVHALELAALHGVSGEALLRELEPKSATAPCSDCDGGIRVTKGRYLGERETHMTCPTCGGTGAASKGREA